ncbi:MAG: hypothetical protein FWD82_02930 [Defluviitaleaceae bacterium]|nr:hypothetical protein [Defluviitaleaceae bacterium]
MSDSNVVFKIVNDEVLVILDEAKKFKELSSSFLEKIKQSESFFKGSNISVTFKGKVLKKAEEEELLNLIRASGAKIKEVTGSPSLQNLTTARQNDTIFHRGSLRGGQAIKHEGSVVVIGDVNPGGEIVATGNIIVMGALKGLAHAGSKGDRDCFVAALNLVPSALRIADIITSIAEEYGKKNTKQTLPTYAYIHEGQIYIAPLV